MIYSDHRNSRRMAFFPRPPSFLFFSTEKNLLEHKDKIPEEVKADVQKAIDELKAVMESEDAEQIKEKVQALQVSRWAVRSVHCC